MVQSCRGNTFVFPGSAAPRSWNWRNSRPSPTRPGEVRIKVLAAGTGFTDSFIRRGRYPDFKGPLPFTPGYELVGIVEKIGPGVAAPREGHWSLISAWSAAMRSMRSVPRAF